MRAGAGGGGRVRGLGHRADKPCLEDIHVLWAQHPRQGAGVPFFSHILVLCSRLADSYQDMVDVSLQVIPGRLLTHVL